MSSPTTQSLSPTALSRAFTLIELVIVIAILGIVGAIAIPRFAGATTRYRLDLAASRLEGDAVLAAEWARSAGQSHVMSFDTGADRYTIISGADGSGATRADVFLGQSPYSCDIQSVTLSGGGAKLVFDGFGRPSMGASVTLRVGDATRTVVLADVVTRPTVDEGGAGVIDPNNLPPDLVPDFAAGAQGAQGAGP